MDADICRALRPNNSVSAQPRPSAVSPADTPGAAGPGPGSAAAAAARAGRSVRWAPDLDDAAAGPSSTREGAAAGSQQPRAAGGAAPGDEGAGAAAGAAGGPECDASPDSSLLAQLLAEHFYREGRFELGDVLVGVGKSRGRWGREHALSGRLRHGGGGDRGERGCSSC
jgi:hypothetical protein